MRGTIPVLLFGVALALLSGRALAGSGYHNTPGSECGAFNTNQANDLERNGFRIFLPGDATRDLFVLCPLYRVQEDMQATTNAPTLWTNVFFDSGVATGTEVDCVIRFLDELNVSVPGEPPVGVLEQAAITATKTAPTNSRQIDDVFVALTNASTTSWAYYTTACKLVPGTGINSFDFFHQ